MWTIKKKKKKKRTKLYKLYEESNKTFYFRVRNPGDLIVSERWIKHGETVAIEMYSCGLHINWELCASFYELVSVSVHEIKRTPPNSPACLLTPTLQQTHLGTVRNNLIKASQTKHLSRPCWKKQVTEPRHCCGWLSHSAMVDCRCTCCSV